MTAYVDVPWGRLGVVDHGGDGPDLLLLHGAGRTLADWALVRPHLHGRRLVSMDFPWHGHSDDGPDATLETFADAAEAVVDTLGLDNPYVAGHSVAPT